MVVHGGIDGFSRLVPYLQVAGDNLARTAIVIFSRGIQHFGIPSRIRVDGGGEFVHINTFMERANGFDQGSYISGRSVHNQRIERLWRDVYCKVLDKYYKLFHYMEDNNVLDLTNDVHIYCLHHVFLPRIQADLERWMTAHNNHGLRTEHHRTPLQIWFSTNLLTSAEDNTAMNNLFRRNQDEIGHLIDEFLEESINWPEPGNINVLLPRIPRPVTAMQYNELQRNINVLAASNSEGLDIYGQVVRFVCQCINSA